MPGSPTNAIRPREVGILSHLQFMPGLVAAGAFGFTAYMGLKLSLTAPTVLGGVLLYANSRNHVMWGALVIISSLFSIYPSNDRTIVGTMLGIFGGVRRIQ